MQDTWKGLLKDLFTLFILIVFVVIPIRSFAVSPYLVDGESMLPTFENNDYLVVNRLVYLLGDPDRGDVIVFRYPKDPSVFYIKRVIGLPGETVSIKKGVVEVVDIHGHSLLLEEPYIVNEDATYTKDITLTEGEYFVMGDNRPNSSDSRMWGPLREKFIIGRADLRLLPFQKLDLLPGAVLYPAEEELEAAL